jgi:hypothetical protein
MTEFDRVGYGKVFQRGQHSGIYNVGGEESIVADPASCDTVVYATSFSAA